MPSFDIVSKVDMQEVHNAVNQSMKEIGQRYDFKGSKSGLTLEESELKVLADDEFKLKAVLDILQSKLVKRKVSLKSLLYGNVEPAAGGMVRQMITVQQGISRDKAREIVDMVKRSKIRVQAQIQDDQVRVSGKNRDDLQAVIALLKERDLGVELQFNNYRE